MTSEFTRQIRNSALPPVIPDYKSVKVRGKNTMNITYYREKDNWKEIYDRRMNQEKQGFFSSETEPYQPLGSLELDTKALVLKTMAGLGFQVKGKIIKEDNHAEIREIQGRNIEAKQKVKKQKQAEHRVNTNLNEARRRCKLLDDGKRYLASCLRDAKYKRTSVIAGQPLSLCLKKESTEKRRQELQRERMEEKKRKDMIILDPEEPTAMMTAIASDCNVADTWHIKDSRKQRNFLAMVECLFQVFCCLTNMKTKELRSKIPLPKSLIKSLCRDNNLVFHYDSTILPSLAKQFKQSSAFYLEMPAKSPENIQEQVTSDRDYNIGSPRIPGTPSVTLCQQSNQSNISIAQASEICSKNDALQSPPKVDLTIPDKKPRRTCTFNRKELAPEMRNYPPWMRVSQEKSPVDGIAGKDKCTSQKLEGMVAVMEKIKEKQLKKSKQATDVRTCFYKERFEFMDLCRIKEESFRSLREKIRKWQKEISEKAAKPPEWFQRILADADDIGLMHNVESCRKINILSAFVLTDMSKILNLKAKLCLMVFSLPVYDLCKLEMQEAIKFFLREVMECSSSALNDWMRQRKLRYQLPLSK